MQSRQDQDAFPSQSVKLLRVIARLLQISALLGIATAASGQGVSRPNVPDKIKAPAGEGIVLQAHVTGSQIYVCQAGADGRLALGLEGSGGGAA
jgi:hypothetical protein